VSDDGVLPGGVVVVGASLAGLRACETLRNQGYGGRITLIGDEARAPYTRPPLSKKLLSGEWGEDRVHLRKPDDFDALALELRLGVRATALDASSRIVTLADGSGVPFDGLVIATGAAPRRLPNQPDLQGIFMLRTLDEAHALRAALLGEPRPRVVVIGAGFIGLEVAATARSVGCDVLVLEGLPAPLVRGLGAEMGTVVAAVHGRNGVEVRCGVRVQGIEASSADASRVGGVRLESGELIAADVVVVGIGVAPNTEWLEGSGLVLRDGVVCDATLNVGVPGIYAAGDCVRWPNSALGDDASEIEVRVEHWTNAAEQGTAAAANLLAVARGQEPTPYAAVPFFWSDQYDSRIQFLGRAAGGDDVQVVHGDLGGNFVALYGKGGRLRGVLGVGSPKIVMSYRALLAAGASWDEALAFAAGA
jgi:NADPH-dependent 2,4-dienoyl-CoA reductase/sulfur reductase-like enzyme